MISKYIFPITASFGAIAVILGAFGAHGLEGKLSVDQLNSYDTAVKYQMFHVLALLAVGILMKMGPSSQLNYSAWFFIAGIILFSGSIYLLSCADILGITNKSFLGPITPVGGLCFILGWVFLAISKF